jgi:hypothetical protein
MEDGANVRTPRFQYRIRSIMIAIAALAIAVKIAVDYADFVGEVVVVLVLSSPIVGLIFLPLVVLWIVIPRR